MATVIGDRDVLLLGSSQRALNPLGSKIILGTSAPAFKVDSNGNALPSTITVTAALIGIAGTVSFTATGATVTDNHDNTATLAYSSLTGTTCTVTASITVNGQAFTASVTLAKVTDGAKGDNGSTGNQYATAYMYQWAPSTPANPNGTTGYTWATGINSTYTGTDNWSVTVPANPGTPSLKLYVAAVAITAAGGTASTVVSYATASVQAWAQNGSAGASGIQSATVMVYQWAATIPAAPAGTTTYTWNGGALGSIPSGWTATPGVAPSQGITLWAAKVYVTDSATVTQTTINWTSSAIIAVGFSGSNGNAGTNGASYVTAYCASSTGTATSAPAQTTGRASLPATNSAGLTGSWSTTVPTLSVGQYLYQTDGIYDPTTDKVTWSIPYWSSLKVGSLSAITGNMGRLYITDTVSDSANNWSIDSNGHMDAKSWTLRDSSNNVILSAGGQLAASAAAPGTLNSQQQWGDVIGRPTDDAIKNNLIDLSWWSRGATTPWTQNSEYNSIAKCSPTSGADLLMPGPKGSDDAVWYCKEVTGDGGPGGGWEAPYFTLDPTKTYRFVVPIRRVSGNGQAYWGTHGVADLNTTNLQGNPYFVNGLGVPATDRWYLFVGYIFPANSVGNTHDSAGVWDCKSGGKITSGYNFCFMPDGRQVNHRAYQFYANLNSEQVFGRPMINLVDGTEPSLREYFDSTALLNSQQQWVDVSGTGKPADNATVGAPPGTYVGGMEAGLAASYAANGNSAYNAVNDATNGLSQKLKSNAQNILSGGAGLSAGTLAWDGSGNRTSGSGVGINRNGIVAYNNSGVATFTLDATNGSATFAGALAAATGTFGAVSIASGGYVASGQTAYNTGTGFFLGFSGSTPVFSLGYANGTGIRWDGTTLTIQNPVIATPFSATITSSSSTYTVSRSATNGYGGSYTANPANGTGPYTYSWTVSTSGISRGWIGGSSTGQQAQLSIEANGRLNGEEQDFYMTCIVTDTASNVSKTVTYLTTILFS